MTRSRLLFAAAAALTAATLVVPLWGFRMSAPQYPDEALHLQVSRTGLSGDVHEIETLQQYIGVRFPTEFPELRWVTMATVALSGLLLLGAVANAGALARFYRIFCLALLAGFIVASAALVQNRLYEVGHTRDTKSPLVGIHDFTPPLVGPARVGNFTVWSFPHVGGVLFLVAAGLTAAGARPRRRSAPAAPHASRRAVA
jgi:hypothetical protein